MNDRGEIRTSTLTLEDAEQVIQAIRSGGVDAFVVQEPQGQVVYALQNADLPYCVLVQRMQQGAAMLNSRGEMIFCNPSLASLLGMDSQAVVGIALHEFVEKDDREAFQKLFHDVQHVSREGELRLHRAGGSVIQARFAFTTLSRDESVTGVLITDLTAEKSYAELASRIQRLRDEERRSIARELHDSVGQLLSAISMNLTRVSQQQSDLAGDANDLLKNSLALVDQVTKEIRTISHLLHPPLLDAVGLASAVRWFVDGYSERSRIKVDLQIPPDFGRLPEDIAIAAFRIVQECLTNVYRHSGSDSCSIIMANDPDWLRIEVRDQGKGIPKPIQGTLPSSSGVGLRGMQERIRQLGGDLEIGSSEKGTTVIAMLPSSQNKSRTSETLPQSA